MAEFYETELDADFSAADGMSTLSIGRLINSGHIEFATQDTGNASAADIAPDKIWSVIDHLITIAGPRPA